MYDEPQGQMRKSKASKNAFNKVMQSSISFFFVSEIGFYGTQAGSRTLYLVRNQLELLIVLPLLSKCLDYRPA